MSNPSPLIMYALVRKDMVSNEKHDLGVKPKSFDSLHTDLTYAGSATSVRKQKETSIGFFLTNSGVWICGVGYA